MFLFVNDSNSAALGLLLLRFVVGFGFAGAGILVFVRGEARSARGIAEAAAMIVGGILFALGLITVVGTALLVVVTAVRLADIGLTGAGDRAERRLAIVLLTVFVTVTATGPQRLSADELLGDLDDKLSGFVPAVAIALLALATFGLASARRRAAADR